MRLDLAFIPWEVASLAVPTGAGEHLWPAHAALLLADRLALQGLAVVGGEMYAPRADFWGSSVFEWHTAPAWSATRDEPWQAYVARGCDQARRAVERSRRSDRECFYFLANLDRDEAGGVEISQGSRARRR